MDIVPYRSYILKINSLESGSVSQSILFLGKINASRRLNNLELNALIHRNEAKQREQYRFYLEGKQSAMDGNRYKMLTEIGFNWSVKGRKHAQIDFLERAINERNVPLSSFSEEYHDDGTEEGGNIDDSALMISKAPLHILMGDYNENPQEIAERAIESLQRTQAAKGNLEQPTEVDILLVDS